MSHCGPGGLRSKKPPRKAALLPLHLQERWGDGLVCNGSRQAGFQDGNVLGMAARGAGNFWGDRSVLVLIRMVVGGIHVCVTARGTECKVGMFTCVHYTLSSFTITKKRNVIAVTLVYFPNFIPIYFLTGADAVHSATPLRPQALGRHRGRAQGCGSAAARHSGGPPGHPTTPNPLRL